MFDEEDDFDFFEIYQLVSRFEEMMDKDAYHFFDVGDIEDIIDYYFQENNTVRAKQAINFAMDHYSDSTGIMLRKAYLMISENKLNQAIRIINEIESIEPDNTDVFMAKGLIYSQKKMPEKADIEFDKAIKDAKYPAETCLDIGFEFENQNNFEFAIKYFKKALSYKPEEDIPIYELAFCFESLNQYDEAIQFYTEFLDKNPYSLAAWFNLGLMYNAVELYEKAIEAYDFVIAIDETFASSYFNKANSYANMGMYREAINFYRQTFLYEEPEAVTYFYIGECYQKLDKHTDAVKSFLKSIEFDPGFADAWLEMGVSYDQLDNQHDAIRSVEKAISIEQDNMDYIYVLAGILAKTNRIKDAEKAFKKVISSSSVTPDVYLDYARMIEENRSINEAIKILHEAESKFRDNPLLTFRLSAYNFISGMKKEALLLFENALHLDYDKYTEVVPYAPNMLEDTEVINILENVGNEIQKKPRKRN